MSFYSDGESPISQYNRINNSVNGTSNYSNTSLYKSFYYLKSDTDSDTNKTYENTKNEERKYCDIQLILIIMNLILMSILFFGLVYFYTQYYSILQNIFNLAYRIEHNNIINNIESTSDNINSFIKESRNMLNYLNMSIHEITDLNITICHNQIL
jgi:cell division protein FtsL